jgi:hypothetical protein
MSRQVVRQGWYVYGRGIAVPAVGTLTCTRGEARPPKLYFVRFPIGWSREFVRALRQAGIDCPGSGPTSAGASEVETDLFASID